MNKKCFFPDFTYIVWKFQKDRTNNKEMGGKGDPQGVQI